MRTIPDLPADLPYLWQKILMLVVRELGVDLAVVSRSHPDGLEVFCRHAAEGVATTLLPSGARFPLDGLCEGRLTANAPLLQLTDQDADAPWPLNESAQTGLRSFLGLPLHWPDGTLMGTLAVYDHNIRSTADQHRQLLGEFRHELEQDLLILLQQQQLRDEVARSQQLEQELANITPKEFNSLWQAAQAVLMNRKFEVSARTIFDEACRMTGATSGYVALLSDDGSENEVLFLEAGGLPCSVDPSLPMPIRGLRAEAYHSHKAVYHNDFMHSQWVEFMPSGHVVLNNVLFSPLNVQGQTVGIMGLANKDGDFTDFDATIAEAFGGIAAIALQNSRTLDALDETNLRLERFNETLVEREMRIIEVKNEVNQLCRELGREPVYREMANHMAG